MPAATGLNRAQRRYLSRKAPHLLNHEHICDAGDHVLYHPAMGYLVSLDSDSFRFAEEALAGASAQRFHHEPKNRSWRRATWREVRQIVGLRG
jgi:hypothetical protein